MEWFVWQRSVPPERASANEIVAAPEFQERLLTLSFPGRKQVRYEVYCLTRREAENFKKRYGGKVSRPPKISKTAGFARRFPPSLILASHHDLLPKKMGEYRPLIIPSGMAFGTGEHATTSACLRLLLSLKLPPGTHVLDAGTGTGILAIAAELLGYRAFGIDHDPDSIRVARENAFLNHCRKVRFRRIPLEGIKSEKTYGLILANIYSSILVACTPRLVRLLQPGGYAIFSGIMAGQEDEVILSACARGLTLRRIVKNGKWRSLLLQL